jgi:hypothetical protein
MPGPKGPEDSDFQGAKAACSPEMRSSSAVVKGAPLGCGFLISWAYADLHISF